MHYSARCVWDSVEGTCGSAPAVECSAPPPSAEAEATEPMRNCFSSGDPHVRPFYGEKYDMMAAGIFTYVSLPSAPLLVQAHHCRTAVWPGASFITAVAVRAGAFVLSFVSDAVTVRSDGEGGAVVLRLPGQEAALITHVGYVNGAELTIHREIVYRARSDGYYWRWRVVCAAISEGITIFFNTNEKARGGFLGALGVNLRTSQAVESAGLCAGSCFDQEGVGTCVHDACIALPRSKQLFDEETASALATLCGEEAAPSERVCAVDAYELGPRPDAALVCAATGVSLKAAEGACASLAAEGCWHEDCLLDACAMDLKGDEALTLTEDARSQFMQDPVAAAAGCVAKPLPLTASVSFSAKHPSAFTPGSFALALSELFELASASAPAGHHFVLNMSASGEAGLVAPSFSSTAIACTPAANATSPPVSQMSCEGPLSDLLAEARTARIILSPPCAVSGVEVDVSLAVIGEMSLSAGEGARLVAPDVVQAIILVATARAGRRRLTGAVQFWMPAPEAAGECPGYADLPACVSEAASYTSSLYRSNIVVNNMGGVGPDLGVEHVVRVRRAVRLSNGSHLDVTITNTSLYEVLPDNPKARPSVTYPDAASNRSAFIRLPIVGGSSSSFELCFWHEGTDEPARLPGFHMLFADLDQGANGTNVEVVTVEGASSSFRVPDTVVELVDSGTGADRISRFSSSEAGGGDNNPVSLSTFWPAQRRQAVVAHFDAPECVRFAASVGPPAQGFSRNVLFALTGGALQPPCLDATATLTSAYDINRHSTSTQDKCVDEPVSMPVAQAALQGRYSLDASLVPSELRPSAHLTVSSSLSGHFEIADVSRTLQAGGAYFCSCSDGSCCNEGGSWWGLCSDDGPLTWEVGIAACAAADDPQAPLPVQLQAMDKVWMVPRELREMASSVRGTVRSVTREQAEAVSLDGAFVVSLYRGMDSCSRTAMAEDEPHSVDKREVAQARTEAGGYFSFEGLGLEPGMYSLCARAYLSSRLQVEEAHMNVLWNEQEAVIYVLVRDEPVATARMLLSWDGGVAGSELREPLRLSFRWGDASCTVWSARDACGGAELVATDEANLMQIAVSEWASDTDYFAYALLGPRRCVGHAASPPSDLPGGRSQGDPGGDGDSPIDCVGDCQTGRGYCYASAEFCVPCVLWAPVAEKGEVLCGPYGEPQGGILPRDVEWAAQLCPLVTQEEVFAVDGRTGLPQCSLTGHYGGLALRLYDRNGLVQTSFSSEAISTASHAVSAPEAVRMLHIRSKVGIQSATPQSVLVPAGDMAADLTIAPAVTPAWSCDPGGWACESAGLV